MPADADTWLLKSILHNWDDAQCATILRNCRRAMSAAARLLLVERILPARMPDGGSPAGRDVARADLNMLIGIGGRERTAAEFDALLAAASFRIVGIDATALEFSVIEALPL